MSDVKIDTIRSSSSGTLGRAVSQAREARLVLDSSSRPQPDVLTNSEAFLGGISSCGVTLIEMHAAETSVPLRRLDVTIEGRCPLHRPGAAATAVKIEVTAVPA